MPSLKNKRKPGLRGKSKKTSLRKTKKSMNKKTSRRGRQVHVGGMEEEKIKEYIEKWFRKTLITLETRKPTSIRQIVEAKNKSGQNLIIEKLLKNDYLKQKIVDLTQDRDRDSKQTINSENRKKIFSDALDWYLEESHINYPEQIKEQQDKFYKNLDELRYVFFNSLHLLEDGELELNLEDAEVLLGCNFVQQNSSPERKIDTNALRVTYKSLYPDSNNLKKIQLEERIKKMSNYDSLSENGLYTKSYLQKILDYLKLYRHEKDKRCPKAQ